MSSVRTYIKPTLNCNQIVSLAKNNGKICGVFVQRLDRVTRVLDQKLLFQKAQIITFRAGEVLSLSGDRTSNIYYLTKGSVALLVANKVNDIRSGLAVGLVGSEGALGLQVALGLGAGNLKLIAQSSGQAYAVDAALASRLVKRKSGLLHAFVGYLRTEYESLTRFAAMSHNQDIRLRYASWLLLSAQRCAPDALMLTHSQIANMLGVRRVSITLAARELKEMGLITYSRGHIQLKNPEALQRLIDP